MHIEEAGRRGLMEGIEPVNAYVFIEHLDPGARIRPVLKSLSGQPGVEFVAQFVGSFVGFGRVCVDTLAELQDLIAGDFWESGVRSSWSIVIPTWPDIPIAKKGGSDFCALVRIATSGSGNAIDVGQGLIDAFAGWNGQHFGVALVSGKGYDLVVSIAADSTEQLVEAIFDRVRTVSGIESTETAFADLRNNAIGGGHGN